MSESQDHRTKFQSVDEGMRNQRSYFANRNIVDSEKKKGERNRLEILRHIASSEPEGVSTSKLVTELNLHRDTVHTNCKTLMTEGLVTKAGKFGNYQVTTRAYQYPELTARIFFNESLRWIRSNTSPVLTLKEEEDNETRDTVKERYEREHETFWNKLYQIHSDSLEKKTLLKFAVDIGMLITHIMIEAVRPHHDKKYINNTGKEVEIDLKPGEKRRQAELWVQNAINANDILNEFIKLPMVKRGITEPQYMKEIRKKNINPALPENKKKELLARHRFLNTDNPKYSPYEMDEQSFKKLKDTLYELWPWSIDKFDDVQNRLPEIIKSGYEQAEFNKDQLQKLKEGEAKTKESKLIEYANNALYARSVHILDPLWHYYVWFNLSVR